MTVLIAAHYNLNNGDRALLEATLQIIEKMIPGSEIIVSAYMPEILKDDRFTVVGWAFGHGFMEKVEVKLSKLKFFRFVFRKCFEIICDKHYLDAVKRADLVLMSGGHHLTDILSIQNYYKLSSNFYIPIALNKKVVLLPQSIGPATNKDIQDSIKNILQKAYSVAYRDDSSKTFINNLGISINSRFVPDLVYSLQPSKSNVIREKIVGIALYHSYAEEKREKLLPFTLRNLTLVIDALLRKGYFVKVIPMDSGDEEFSQEIYSNLKAEEKKDKYIIADRGSEIMDIVNQFATVSFCLAYKTHSTIFSMICNTPLVAIAYHPKSIEFMDKVGLREYSINDSDASFDNLMDLINKLENNYDQIREKEYLGVIHNRNEINAYLQEILC